MRLLVTGAAGMLGRDIANAAAAAGHELTALGRAELDITDVGAVEAAMLQTRPDAVVNCAAWTDVDGAEAQAEQAFAVNGPGAGNVAETSALLTSSPIPPSRSRSMDVASSPASLRSPRSRPRRTRSSVRRGCSAPAVRAFRRRSCASPRSGIRSPSSMTRLVARRSPVTSHRR